MTVFTDFTGASYEYSATRFTSQLQLCGSHSMFVPSPLFLVVFLWTRCRCLQIRDLYALNNARCASVSRMGLHRLHSPVF